MAEHPAHAWRTTLTQRLMITAAVLGVWSVVIEARLVYFQVVRHAELTRHARDQQESERDLPAERGAILDRRGQPLAMSVPAPTIFANPGEIEDADQAAAALCAALKDCRPQDQQALRARLARRGGFVYVRRQASQAQADRVAALELKGVGLLDDSKRYYPNRELAAHLLGIVGVDEALEGIEHTYDQLIGGRKGTVIAQTDGKQSRFSNRIERPAVPGATLELTIDRYLQYVTEQALRAGVVENRASGGSAIVMDPWTGEILAMANDPTFNPNAFATARPDRRRNRAVQDVYEPGSTFKIVTAAAALERAVVRPGDRIDVSGGRIRVGSRYISDTRDYGTLSFADVFVKSSNVGSVKVAFQLGAEPLIEYARRFGFGRRSSDRDFPAEAAGRVWEASRLREGDLARVSIGYTVSVTALQMATAVSAIANGGELLQPRVVRAVIDDGVRRTVPRVVVGRAVSAETAATITAMMEGVVDHGTATAAQVPGYVSAGKTGTAEKLTPQGYSRTEHNASFVGFVPSRDPAYVIVVVIDSPSGRNGFFGGPVAGPIFRQIAEAALQYGGIPPTVDAPPPLLASRETRSVYEPVDASLVRSRHVVATTVRRERADGLLPDLSGLNARDAVHELVRLGLEPRVHGTGIVIAQRPEAGTPVEPGTTATLWLERRRSVVHVADTGTP